MNQERTAKALRDRVWGEAHNEILDVTHDEDIRELDNPIPIWWKWILVATIAFAFPYMAFYHGGAEGRTAAELYSLAAAENARLQFAELGELGSDEATLVKYTNDKGWLAVGKGVFQANCGACHGRDGGGKVGPNLCDDKYKNVASITDIYKVVSNGAAAGAMPAWKQRLEQNELVLVSCYVASLRGSTPAVAKAAEGRDIPPWPEYVERESEEPEVESTEQEEDTTNQS